MVKSVITMEKISGLYEGFSQYRIVNHNLKIDTEIMIYHDSNNISILSTLNESKEPVKIEIRHFGEKIINLE